MDKEGNQEEHGVKFVWKMSYTWVLVFNILYILFFYWLMKTYVVYAG
ncbi:MAG: hypothetical protein AAF466_02305 [Bacteroidota bacterium]